MDIHKPKPVHNLREFLGEIAVIIIGVLIALGLEQAVEAWHWREEVVAERAALKAEELDGRSIFLARQQIQPCIERRLAEVRLVQQRHHDGRPLGIIAPIGRPDGSSIGMGSWQIALASQGLAHIPLEEKLDFSSRFGSYAKFNILIDEEQRLWTRLAALDDVGLLSEANWSSLVDTLAEAKAINNRFRANLPLFLRFTADRKSEAARPQPADDGHAAELCRPMLAPSGSDQSVGA